MDSLAERAFMEGKVDADKHVDPMHLSVDVPKKCYGDDGPHYQQPQPLPTPIPLSDEQNTEPPAPVPSAEYIYNLGFSKGQADAPKYAKKLAEQQGKLSKQAKLRARVKRA